MRAIVPFAVGVAVSLHATVLAAQSSRMTFTLPEGPYRAGFRAVEQYDRTRSFEVGDSVGTGPRPIQTSIWYPARVDRKAAPMRYKDYVYLTASVASFPKPTETLRRATLESFALAFGADSVRRFNELEAPTRAFRDAPPAAGRFPVVIYAPGLNDPSFENAHLAEHLASHGYVVVASPSMGWRSAQMDVDALSLEAQVQDMAFLLDFARTLPAADVTQVIAMGMSFGGLSNFLWQMRDSRVKAVVSLDGSAAYWWNAIGRQSPSAAPARMNVPLLFLQSRPLPDSVTRLAPGIDTAFTLWDSLTSAPALRVRFHELSHPDFADVLVRMLPLPGDFAPQATANYGYEQATRYVLAFLDAHFKGDTAARAFLERSPEANGMPPGFAEVWRRTPSGPAPTLLAFTRLLGPGGPKDAPGLLARLRATQPGYALPQVEVTDWASRLDQQGRFDDALAVCRLDLAMYPDKSVAWLQLGDVHLHAGARDSALAAYRRAVAADSSNGFNPARWRLAALGEH